MALLTCITLIILSLGFGLIIYSRNKQRSLSDLLPKQIKLISELNAIAEQNKIEIRFCNGTGSSVSKTYTLSDIAQLSENAHALTEDEYDDYPVYFSTNTAQLVSFKDYLLNEVMPDNIKEELKPFYNKSYKSVENPDKAYFTIQLKTDTNSKTQVLYKGNGEAYENWLTFRESANDLTFVLKQGLQETLQENQTLVTEL